MRRTHQNVNNRSESIRVLLHPHGTEPERSANGLLMLISEVYVYVIIQLLIINSSNVIYAKSDWLIWSTKRKKVTPASTAITLLMTLYGKRIKSNTLSTGAQKRQKRNKLRRN